MAGTTRDQRVAIMQPYFFPYLGYFSLIKHADRFILLDIVQFIRHGWMDRNRISKQSEGWFWIRVPVLPHSLKTVISDIKVDSGQLWKAKLLAQLDSYRKTAPNFRIIRQLVEDAIAPDYKSITDLNKATLNAVCLYLGLSVTFEVASKMGIELGRATAPDEWSLNICKALTNVGEYWNPPGGKNFYDVQKYSSAGISLKFHEVILRRYDQKRPSFEPGLSIIDALMFNTPAEIHDMLDDYSLS